MCGFCFVIICNPSLLGLMPQKGGASWLWHLMGIFPSIIDTLNEQISRCQSEIGLFCESLKPQLKTFHSTYKVL